MSISASFIMVTLGLIVVLSHGCTLSFSSKSINVTNTGRVITLTDSQTGEVFWAITDLSLKTKLFNIYQYGGNFNITDITVAQTNTFLVQSITEGVNDTCVVNGFIGGDSFDLTFSTAGSSNNVVAFTLRHPRTSGASSYNWLQLCSTLSPQEAVFGLGEQYDTLDLRGRNIPIFVREQGVGRGLQPLTEVIDLAGHYDGGSWATTYTGIPIYHTTSNRSFVLQQYDYSTFDFREANTVCVGVNTSSHLSAFLAWSDSLPDAVSLVTSMTGRPRPLPTWFTAGAIVGMQGGQDKVLGVVTELVKLQCPISSVWLQDWCGERMLENRQGLWWNWEYDTVLYPNWPNFTQNLSTAFNIRTLGYINPMLVNASMKQGVRTNFFDTAAKNGYFVSDWSGYNNASLLNLTNPGARAFYKKIIQDEMLGSGMTGWMADFSEALPAHYGGLHNQYPDLWFGLIYEALEEVNRTADVVFFGRAASVRSPSLYSLGWQGDQLTSWDSFDGLGSVVTALQSGGMSGMAFLHSDIGGYVDIVLPFVPAYTRSAELLYRWCEHSAFTVAYRTHEGTYPELNVQFYSNADTYSHYVRMAKVFVAWKFYRDALVQAAANTGLPVARPVVLHYQGDPKTYNLTAQYLLGEALLVAPVMEPNAARVEVYFPQGVRTTLWTLLWDTNQTFLGGTTALVGAPVGFPAVFYSDQFSGIGEQLIYNLKQAGVYT